MTKQIINLKKINLYLAKFFLLKFLQVALAFSILIFFVNLIEALDKFSDSDASFLVVLKMSTLQIPNFLNDIAPSMTLFAAIITFFTLSLKSEITVIRNCGYSLWHILSPITLCAFLLGVFWITIFDPLSIHMMEKYNKYEKKYTRGEEREIIESQSGIWLKQTNLEKTKEEIVIQAKEFYKENLEFGIANIWFFDENGQFYKKINAEKIFLKDGFWVMKNIVINDKDSLNLKKDEMQISTNLKADFVAKRIVDNFQNEKLFSIFSLPKLIKSLKMAGLQSIKFEVRFNHLLVKPILFAAMIFVACFFGINNFRNQNAILMVFFGIIFGLALYICLNFIAALGSSKLIPVFAATWVVSFICLAIGILLIYQKESN